MCDAPRRRILGVAALVLVGICAAPAALAQLPSLQLDNGVVQARVSTAAGGRLLSFSLAGRPNFLLVDESAGDPDVQPDAASGHVAWQGHEVWIGPQREWWLHQEVHPARAAAQAAWPPDPYLSLSTYRVLRQDGGHIALDSPASPVSGIQLRKQYALVTEDPRSLRLMAEATNRGSKMAGRDIWFNTRVHPATEVIVPVEAQHDVRTEPAGALDYVLANGLLSLAPPGARQAARRGKLFIQPSHGWMAGFRDGKALVIRFAHQPRAAIHPDQGQVELYQDADPGRPGRGLLEMEVHAPYVQLAPGAAMVASETWTILPYEGAAERTAHIDFLRRHARQLGLGGLD